jgi:hypothetical protein
MAQAITGQTDLSADTTAIQQLIQKADDEQAQALAAQDPSVMTDTATAEHLQELQGINQDLRENGVSAIKLTKLEWGPIAVNGKTANATAYETWSTTYSNGTVSTTRDTNEYTLVQQNGSWKIQADVNPSEANSESSEANDEPDGTTPASGQSAERAPATPPSPSAPDSGTISAAN